MSKRFDFREEKSVAFVRLQHDFIRSRKDLIVLQQMIEEVEKIEEKQKTSTTNLNLNGASLIFGNDATLTNRNLNKQEINESRTTTNRNESENDTFQSSSCNTMIELSSESSDTMIINENETETENDADSQQETLKVVVRRFSSLISIRRLSFCSDREEKQR